MICFCDTSALVKLYVPEAGTAAVRAAVDAAAAVAVSVLAYVESLAAFARQMREGRLPAERYERAGAAFLTDWPRLARVAVDDPLLVLAADQAVAHRLRAHDAVQLASALRLRDALAGRLVFCCSDGSLAEAATAAGLDVLLPGAAG